MRTIAVFFYGLYMDEALLRQKGIVCYGRQVASLPGYALRVGQRATLAPAEGERAHGVLAALSHADVDRLYADPAVAMYRPEAVLAEAADGARVPALCFNLPEVPAQARNAEYVERLRAVAQAAGLPKEYVAKI
jgi:hypothetical protein